MFDFIEAQIIFGNSNGKNIFCIDNLSIIREQFILSGIFTPIVFTTSSNNVLLNASVVLSTNSTVDNPIYDLAYNYYNDTNLHLNENTYTTTGSFTIIENN